ncbi:hypothetical protein H0E87_012550, partial [Populus deltoides]
ITAIDQQQRLHGKNVSHAWPLDPNSPSMEAYQFWAQNLMDSHNQSHESASEENQQVMIHQTSITSTDNSQASRRPHHMIADEHDEAYEICKMISDGKTLGIGSGTNLEEFTDEIRNEVKKEVEDWRAIQKSASEYSSWQDFCSLNTKILSWNVSGLAFPSKRRSIL